MRKLVERDSNAFETFIRLYQAPVLNFLYRMIGNKEEARDLAQEVFVTVFKKIDTFRGDASLSTWLYRIAANHCKNRQKYLTRRHHHQRQDIAESEHRQIDSETMSTSARISRPDELVEGYQMERAIQTAIASLDEDHRLVLILRDIQNMTYEEISNITGLATGTVKSRLHRARMSLKEKLAAHLR